MPDAARGRQKEHAFRQEVMKTTVVHCSRSRYDVYIGRGNDPVSGLPSKWGNPFVIGKDGTRAEVLKKHSDWVPTQPHLMAALHELKNKRLGCWCRPMRCHGDNLVKLIEKLAKPKVEKDIFGD